MATATTDFLARVRADSSQAVAEFSKLGNQIEKSMDRASNSTEKLDNALVKMARGAVGGVAFREIAQFSMSMVKSTAQLEDTIAAAGVTFGEYSDQIEEFAKSAARNFGISKVAALDAANQFAALGKSAGLTGEELAGFSTEMVSLAGDMASFRGTSVEDAITAIGSGLRGEQEPLRRFGVLLGDATLKARAMAMGIYDGNGVLTAQQKVLAAQAEILAQTSDAQGDFARTSDSTANSLKIAAAEMENAKAAAGEALAPALTALTQTLTPVLQGFAAMPEQLQVLTVNMALAAGAFSSGSQALQGLGVATKTANGIVGSVVGTLGLATTAYALYSKAKQEATDRTNAFIDALAQEGPEQKGAIERLVASDEDFGRFVKALDELGLTMADVQEFTEKGTGSIADMQKAVMTFNPLVPDMRVRIADLAREMGVSADAIRIVSDITYELPAAFQEATDATARLNRVTADGGTVNQKYARFLGLVEEKTIDVQETVEEKAEALEADKKAIEKVNDAYRDQLELIEELYGDQRDAIQRQLDYADAMTEYGETVGDAEASVRDQLDAAIELAEQFGTLNGAILDSEEGVNRQVEAFDQMLATLKPGSALYNALLEHRNQLDAIPETVNTLISLGFGRGATSGKGVVTTGSAAVKTLLGDLLAGASVFGAGPAELGAPVPDVSKALTGDMAAGGRYRTGPVNLTVNVYRPVASGEQIANELAAYVRRNGTRFLQGVS